MDDEVGALLNELGRVLAKDTAYPIDGTFLYVEAEPYMIDYSVFKDLGDHLLWRSNTDELPDILLQLWNAEVPEKRWSTMQYRIEADRFEASFTHEPLDPEVSTLDRRRLILQQRYGNKRIEYPALK